MPIQQQINSDVLFIKHRKLYYLLTAYAQSVVYYISDKITFNDSLLKNELIQTVIDDIYIVEQNNRFDPLNKYSHKDFFPIFGKIYNGYEYQDLQIKSYTDFFLYSDLKRILKQSDVATVSYKDQMLINDMFKDVDKDNNTKQQNLIFADSVNKSFYNVSYQQNIFTDSDNEIIVNQNGYSLKLYIGDKFLLNSQDVIFDNKIAKDLIFKACEDNELYLKLYDPNNHFVKKFILRKTDLFNVQINNILYYQNSIRFKSNLFYLSGYNIYHGNSICQLYNCNIYQNNLIYHKPLEYSIISSGNIQKNAFIVFKTNSYAIFRVMFDKIVFLKQINFNFNLNLPSQQYSLKIRYGLENYMLSKQRFIDYKTDFYCKTIDVRIDYRGLKNIQLNSFDFKTYDFSQEDIVYSNQIVFNNQNNIFLTKKQMLNNTVFTKYSNYVTTKDDLSSIVYDNIKNVDSDYFQSDNAQNYSNIQFALLKNASTGSVQGINNNFRHIYLEYKLQQKKDSTLFDLKYFQILGKKYNFPKYVVLTLADNIKRVFTHQTAYKSNNTFIEKWNFSYVIYASDNATQQERNVQVSGVGDYFYFSYYKIITDLVQQWKTSCFVKIGSEYNEYTTDAISFIGGLQTNGFIFGASYEFVKRDKIYPQYRLYTKEYNVSDQYYQRIVSNSFNVTNQIKRDFKISFRDGDDQRFKLYTIVFQNYDNSIDYNVFQQQNKNLISITGNDTNNPNGIIKNNFYNVIYSINYNYSSKLMGKIIQADRAYFDLSTNDLYNKSNLHFTWNGNYKFQYIILFDKFSLSKYKDYFLPFVNHMNYKNPYRYNEYVDQKQYFNRIYYFKFDKKQIITSINLINKLSLKNNLKFDYYYSYSNDEIQWSQNFYYKPFVCFYAKFVIVKCISNSEQLLQNITLSYLNSDNYYLTDKFYFDSIMLKTLQTNERYLFHMQKYYNGQFFDSTLKLFQIGNCDKLIPIQNLYVDNLLIARYARKISGYDNKCTFKFIVPNNIQISKFNIVVYCNNKQIDNLFLVLNNNNGQYSYDYVFQEKYFKNNNCFSYKVMYFDSNDNVSQFSNEMVFYFNNIPTVPKQLGVSEINIVQSSSSSGSSLNGGLL